MEQVKRGHFRLDEPRHSWQNRGRLTIAILSFNVVITLKSIDFVETKFAAIGLL